MLMTDNRISKNAVTTSNVKTQLVRMVYKL